MSIQRMLVLLCVLCVNRPATTEIYTDCHTLSLHDALPILAMLTSSAWEAFAIPISRMPAPRCVVSARALRIPGGKPMMPDRKVMQAARARTNPLRRRRPLAPLPPQETKRQGAISALAFQLLVGRDPALTFLNGESAALHDSTIAIATLSKTGYAIVWS